MWWERFWGARGEGAGSKGGGVQGARGVKMGARRRDQNPIEYDIFLIIS